MNTHTPVPWKIKKQKGKNLGGMIMQQPPFVASENGKTICSLGGGSVFYENAEANAEFIVRAVNNLEALIARLLHEAVEIHHHERHLGCYAYCKDFTCVTNKDIIKKAEGGA